MSTINVNSVRNVNFKTLNSNLLKFNKSLLNSNVSLLANNMGLNIKTPVSHHKINSENLNQKNVEKDLDPEFTANIEHWTPGFGEVGHLSFSLNKTEKKSSGEVTKNIDHVGLWPNRNPNGVLEKINSFINNTIFPIGTPTVANLYRTIGKDIKREDDKEPSHITKIKLTKDQYEKINGNINDIQNKHKNGELTYSLFPNYSQLFINSTKDSVYQRFSENPFSGLPVETSIDASSTEVHHCTTIVDRVLEGTGLQPKKTLGMRVAPWVIAPADYYHKLSEKGISIKALDTTDSEKINEKLDNLFENNEI
jgi:hypothetical protein